MCQDCMGCRRGVMEERSDVNPNLMIMVIKVLEIRLFGDKQNAKFHSHWLQLTAKPAHPIHRSILDNKSSRNIIIHS